MNSKLIVFGEVAYMTFLSLLIFVCLPLVIAVAVIGLNNPLIAFGGTGLGATYAVVIFKAYNSRIKGVVVAVLYVVLVIIACLCARFIDSVGGILGL